MTNDPELVNRTELHGRLIALRAELVNWLVRDGIEGGTLALLADVGAAIEACDVAAERPRDIIANGRAVLSDDGVAIMLTLYSEAGAVAGAALDPQRAVALAGELIMAALPKLVAP